MLGIVLLLAGATAAHADFVVTMCNGSPASPWTEGYNATQGWASVGDNCAATDGTYSFDLGSTEMGFNQSYGAGIEIPSGETLTHVLVNYHSMDTSSGSEAFLRWGYAQNFLGVSLIGDDHAGTTFSVAVPDAADFWFNVFCSTSASTNCYFPSPFGIVTIGQLDLTLHDTGLPTIQSGGGSLAAKGVYRGEQTLIYEATDAGSGVDRVTAALGSTVVGTAQSSCQSWNLKPCPASTAGTLDINTNDVPNGTYPVILTAYDASGDGTPLQVSTVTVRNPVGSTKVTGRARHAVHAQVEMTWRWDRARTRLTALTLRDVPRTATVTIACQGRRCPIGTVRAPDRRLAGLVRALVGKAFHAGEVLAVTISAPRLRPEQAHLEIVRNALPRVRRG